mmetsp:Transcript_12625/g.18411  ORF Transcript_12625/g.18411 Transcript_12625/m.18411 type:complete len:201 (+) Transcript_12625:53-655(+)
MFCHSQKARLTMFFAIECISTCSWSGHSVSSDQYRIRSSFSTNMMFPHCHIATDAFSAQRDQSSGQTDKAKNRPKKETPLFKPRRQDDYILIIAFIPIQSCWSLHLQHETWLEILLFRSLVPAIVRHRHCSSSLEDVPYKGLFLLDFFGPLGSYFGLLRPFSNSEFDGFLLRGKGEFWSSRMKSRHRSHCVRFARAGTES